MGRREEEEKEEGWKREEEWGVPPHKTKKSRHKGRRLPEKPRGCRGTLPPLPPKSEKERGEPSRTEHPNENGGGALTKTPPQ